MLTTSAPFCSPLRRRPTIMGAILLFMAACPGESGLKHTTDPNTTTYTDGDFLYPQLLDIECVSLTCEKSACLSQADLEKCYGSAFQTAIPALASKTEVYSVTCGAAAVKRGCASGECSITLDANKWETVVSVENDCDCVDNPFLVTKKSPGGNTASTSTGKLGTVQQVATGDTAAGTLSTPLSIGSDNCGCCVAPASYATINAKDTYRTVGLAFENSITNTCGLNFSEAVNYPSDCFYVGSTCGTYIYPCVPPSPMVVPQSTYVLIINDLKSVLTVQEPGHSAQSTAVSGGGSAAASGAIMSMLAWSEDSMTIDGATMEDWSMWFNDSVPITQKGTSFTLAAADSPTIRGEGREDGRRTWGTFHEEIGGSGTLDTKSMSWSFDASTQQSGYQFTLHLEGSMYGTSWP